MAEEHHHHHHHHHHRMDAGNRFKMDSLRSIERNKKIVKILKRVMIALTIILGIAVVLAYTIG